MMIETVDATGVASTDRKFAFYCTRLYPSCVSVYGDTPAAFKALPQLALPFVQGPGTPSPTPLPSTSYPSQVGPLHLPHSAGCNVLYSFLFPPLHFPYLLLIFINFDQRPVMRLSFHPSS